MTTQDPGTDGARMPAEGTEAVKNPCPVVGVGASAGGLEALQAFFSGMPPESGMVFVVVQHFDPRHDTLMPELLAKHTQMPVRLVSDDLPVETNHVYVIPPNATLTIDDCTLRVTKPERARGRRTPIDGFFRSLAEDQGDDAVGVILSGTGTDGALGLRTIKEHGGLTLVQSPSSARYDSMPRAAILTGMADYVVPVGEMAAKLMEHLRRMTEVRGGQSPEGSREEIEESLNKICAVLRRKTGHDFSRYKRSTLVRRIRRRMGELRVPSVASYLEQLLQDVKEVDQLFRDLLIGVTHFFRDPEAFEVLARKAVPRLFENKGLDGQVRVWVPGCATGEEPYSIAILLREHALTLDEPPMVQVFATDIDTHALEIARQGWYPERIADQVSAERLERFFVKHGNMYQVSKEIREMCLFSTHNIIADPPFSRLDMISCRNLLIYLEGELQKKLVPLCHYALRSGGFLFLGPSENVASFPELFRTVDKRHRLFQCKDVILRPPVSFPIAERSRLTFPRPPAEAPQAKPGAGEPSVARAFERILLDHYSPACVLVNERGDVAYFSPRTGKYLEPPAGSPNLNVIDMARPGLRLELRTALHKAITSRSVVNHDNVTYEEEGRRHRLQLSVRPMFELGEDAGLYMVVFQDLPMEPAFAPPAEPGEEKAVPPDMAAEVIGRLEAELRATKDHLQATLEELESSNEELVSSNEELLSINEELQSANEELQTSKEELQSVNEELETINAELKKKIDELDRANSDLVNLFQSTQIATIFVDRDLRIKKFTPAATDVFRLIESDAGRLIADIAPRFTGGADLIQDIRHVLRTLSVRERQVSLVDEEAWYILRILPYRTLDNVIDGVVMTFVDITELRRIQEQRAQLARIVESSQDAILGKTLEGIITSWNRGAEKMYGYSAQEAVGRSIDFVIPPDRLHELGPIFEKLGQGEVLEPFETVRVRKDGQRIDVLLTISPVHDSAGRVTGTSAIARDITEHKRAEEQLLESQRELTDFLENASVGLHWVGPDGTILWANQTELDLLGYTREEYVGHNIAEFHADADVIEDMLRRLSCRETLHEYEACMRAKDGSLRHVKVNSNVLWRDDQFIHTRCFTSDITERKQAEAALEASQRRLQALFDNAQDAILLADDEARYVDANPAASELTGYSRDELLGIRVWDLTEGADLQLGKTLWKNFIAAGRQNGEYTLVRGDGGRVAVEYRAVANVLPGLHLAVLNDVSERRRTEEALREAARRKDEFLAMLGHELRNPLAPIRNCLHVMKQSNATESQVERARDTIERQVVHLTRLVDDLLDVSRISQGKILLRKERLDLVELVRATVEDHRGALAAAGLALELDFPSGPLWVSGDPTRLSQSVGNVLHNAGKFTDRGGRVTVAIRREGRTVVVAVRDTGIGIEPEVLGKLFEPFSQAPPGLDRSRSGLGLGLALVRRLIALHGGAVEASSEGIGRGAEIRLLLPLDGQDAAAAAQATKEGREMRSRRCLLIEDNRDAAESMALLLQLVGHEAAVAYDGVQGLAKAREMRPEIVLCDIGLPGMDGYEVARILREDPELRSVCLIALTGYGQEEDQRQAREAGFDVHLTKPVDPETLRRILESCP
ncbi:MAG TPA: PAS domain S-box protein [Thermoanaerobaculia bacterium]